MDTKAVSYNDHISMVNVWWSYTYGNEPPYLYPIAVYSDYIIVGYSGFYIRVGYEMDGDTVTFDDPEEWTVVEMEFKSGGVQRVMGLEPIKSINDKGRYGVYVVRFGDPEHRDLHGNYFTKDSNFYLDWYDRRPWLYHHGLKPVKTGPIRSGYWDTFATDDEGVFFEGELAESFEYQAAIQELLAAEKLYPSTGAAGYMVKASEDGWLSDWPIIEASSTVSPAEFRHGPIAPNVAKAVKTLEGGIAMGGVLGGVQAALDKLTARKNAVDEEESTEAEPQDEEAVQTSAEDVADEGEEPETEEASTAPVLSAEVEAIAETVQELVKAVVALDDVVNEQSEVIKALETALEEVAKDTEQQVKAAMTKKSWFENLHLQSRDGPAVKADEEVTPQQPVQPDDSGAGIYERLRASQGL